jgi:hypothetical protein
VQLDPCEQALPGRSRDDDDVPPATERRLREAFECRRGDSLVVRADDFVARRPASRVSEVPLRPLLDARRERCGEGAEGRPACEARGGGDGCVGERGKQKVCVVAETQTNARYPLPPRKRMAREIRAMRCDAMRCE